MPDTDPALVHDAALAGLAGATDQRAAQRAAIGIALSAIVAELADDCLEEIDSLTGLLVDLDQFISWSRLAASGRALQYAAESVTLSAEQLRPLIAAPSLNPLATATARIREVHEQQLRELEGSLRIVNDRLGSTFLAAVGARIGALRVALGRIEARLDLQEQALRRVDAHALAAGAAAGVKDGDWP